MASVRDEVQRLLQAMMMAAGPNEALERETVAIIPLAMAHALSYEKTCPENINLCAQVSVIKALQGLPVRGSA